MNYELYDIRYIYEHEAIQKPISENNIGAPSAPQKRQFSISVELETAIVYRKFDFAINGISYSSTLFQMPRQEVDMTSYWYTDPGYSSVRQREFSTSERQCEFLVSEWQRDFSGPVGRRFFPGV